MPGRNLVLITWAFHHMLTQCLGNAAETEAIVLLIMAVVCISGQNRKRESNSMRCER